MTQLPAPIERLRDQLKADLAADVDIEPLDEGPPFLLTVFSDHFKNLTHLQRQDRVWAIVDATCGREDSLLISMILTYAPGEIEAFVEGLGK
jgi:hypothetical protein